MYRIRHIAYPLLAAALLTACTQDKADIPQSHSLLELTASMAGSNTRATPDGTWTGGEKVAVLATNHNGGGAAYTYIASTTDKLTPEDITNAHYWATGEASRDVCAPSTSGKELRKILYGMEASPFAELGAFKATRPERAIRKVMCCGL